VRITTHDASSDKQRCVACCYFVNAPTRVMSLLVGIPATSRTVTNARARAPKQVSRNKCPTPHNATLSAARKHIGQSCANLNAYLFSLSAFPYISKSLRARKPYSVIYSFNALSASWNTNLVLRYWRMSQRNIQQQRVGIDNVIEPHRASAFPGIEMRCGTAARRFQDTEM
jgi:hypothetical protein